MSDEPRQPQDKYILRLPDGMRERLKDEAAKNKRSLNAEIIARLESTLPSMAADETDPFSVEAIEAEFARLLGRTLDRVRKAESASPRRKPPKP